MPEFDASGEQLYLVCRQCGEAFDCMATANDHTPGHCGSYRGFEVLTETEAM